jgi:hypothetical protein
MKKYRVMYRITEQQTQAPGRTEEVYADGWKVDSDAVVLYQREADAEVPVLDIPKTRIMRIQEVS